MSPLQYAFWFVVICTLSLMTQFAFAAPADEPLVSVTTQLPASKAEECAKSGCLILTEEEAEMLVKEAMANRKLPTCKAGKEV